MVCGVWCAAYRFPAEKIHQLDAREVFDVTRRLRVRLDDVLFIRLTFSYILPGDSQVCCVRFPGQEYGQQIVTYVVWKDFTVLSTA